MNDATRRVMKELLADIQSGAFAERWIADGNAGYPEFSRMREAECAHPLEAVGQRLRDRMAWL